QLRRHPPAPPPVRRPAEPRPVRARRRPVPHRLPRPRQVRRFRRQLDQRPAADPGREPQGLRRPLRALPPPRGDQHRHDDRTGARLMASAERRVTEGHDWSELPTLPTSVVGSYSVPEWLERLKNDFYQRRLSYQHLSEICEVAIKAALKDQELTGIDVVSDGELRRDNDIDYLLARIPGIEILNPAKTYYYDYY